MNLKNHTVYGVLKTLRGCRNISKYKRFGKDWESAFLFLKEGCKANKEWAWKDLEWLGCVLDLSLYDQHWPESYSYFEHEPRRSLKKQFTMSRLEKAIEKKFEDEKKIAKAKAKLNEIRKEMKWSKDGLADFVSYDM